MPEGRTISVALVAVGGCAGTLTRYALLEAMPVHTGAWPWSTFVANVVGSLLLGAAVEWLARSGPDAGRRQHARLLIGTGFCGALTTYSTLAVESDLLIRSSDAGLALGYLGASIASGLVAASAGIALAAGHSERRRRRSA